MSGSGLPLTVTIRSLRAKHDGAEVQLQVLLESGEHREQRSLLLTMEQYYELHPAKGTISEEAYERLEAASEFCQALRCGENLLSYGSNSVQMLTRKLMQRGYSRELSCRAATHLAEVGLIQEAQDLRREVEKCVRKLWGARRIKAHLWSRGFGSEVLAELPEILAETDFTESCVTWIRKHYGILPQEREEQKRMVASLSRYGYSIEEIRAAIRQMQS